MHKSRLAGFIIDSKTDDLSGAADFWSAALGYPRKSSDAPEDENYALLDTGEGGLHVEVQKVDHPSRVHIDIETDDVEAEATRLERFGAKKVKFIHDWWVMEAPTGHRFCVVPVRGPFRDGEANEWD